MDGGLLIMRYAWIEAGRIRDITPSDPYSWHHPDVARFYDTVVPDDAANGDFWQDGQLVKPVIVEPLPPPSAPRQWTVADFRADMTLPEKTRWDNDTTPEIVTVKLELPATQAMAQELVDFLVSVSVITSATAGKIMQ